MLCRAEGFAAKLAKRKIHARARVSRIASVRYPRSLHRTQIWRTNPKNHYLCGDGDKKQGVSWLTGTCVMPGTRRPPPGRKSCSARYRVRFLQYLRNLYGAWQRIPVTSTVRYVNQAGDFAVNALKRVIAQECYLHNINKLYPKCDSDRSAIRVDGDSKAATHQQISCAEVGFLARVIHPAGSSVSA